MEKNILTKSVGRLTRNGEMEPKNRVGTLLNIYFQMSNIVTVSLKFP